MNPKTKISGKILLSIFTGLIIILLLGFAGYSIAFTDKIFPNVYILDTNVGGLTRQEAFAAINDKLDSFNSSGLTVTANNTYYVISTDKIDFPKKSGAYIAAAWQEGRTQNFTKNFIDRISLLFNRRGVPTGSLYDPQKLQTEVAEMAEAVDMPVKDISLTVNGTEVTITTETRTGKIINQSEVVKTLSAKISNLDFSSLTVTATGQYPAVTYANAETARGKAVSILTGNLTLKSLNQDFTITPEIIAEWIAIRPSGKNLEVYLDKIKVAQYVENIANALNVEPKNSSLKVIGGKVINFEPPQDGRLLNQEQTIDDIIKIIEGRVNGNTGNDAVELVIKELPSSITSFSTDNLEIKELIGKATTPFAGSPANRISNIKNGTKFLSGILVNPGEEFSTVGALGKIDNTTGYLPELVIKGDRTVPEFGGGLCQVSTTLFRALLNAGLPITARQSHSYRVPYYEKDGDGNYIGPGLDATIYQPQPDLKFINDTGNTILIWGYVKDSKVTFEIYGSKDGRKSEVVGPQKLSETPPGDPVYTETDTLPKGVIKRIETPHPGGTATATYRVTYPNGEVKEQVFKSSYRAWPARYLVGTGENNQTAKNLQ